MKQPDPARAALMRDSNFRWLLTGGLISMLGDQFTLIALPWLVLKLTGDPLAVGLVLALMGIPRAVFMLIGGALVDRHSPKAVLMQTKLVNAVLLGTLAGLVLSNSINMPLVYAIGLAIGLAQAFSYPSGSAIMPQVVSLDQLQAANGMLMGMRQLTTLAGPLLAGLLIALAGNGGQANAIADARGLGFAFAFDCFSFAISAWTLAQVKPIAATSKPAEKKALFASVIEGLQAVWNDRALRLTFSYWGVIMFCIGGAFSVALPVLADTRLHGAGALGLMMGAHAAGSLVGMAISSVKGKVRVGNLGTTILTMDVVAGLLLMPLGGIHAVWQGALLMGTLGIMAGFMQVTIFSWIQGRVPQAMLGRAMSIFMFIFMGLAPLSAACAGWLLKFVPLAPMFLGVGAFLMLAAVFAFVFTPMRSLSESHA